MGNPDDGPDSPLEGIKNFLQQRLPEMLARARAEEENLVREALSRPELPARLEQLGRALAAGVRESLTAEKLEPKQLKPALDRELLDELVDDTQLMMAMFMVVGAAGDLIAQRAKQREEIDNQLRNL
jgi:arsenate reductase-like glutaredoxin family protein